MIPVGRFGVKISTNRKVQLVVGAIFVLSVLLTLIGTLSTEESTAGHENIVFDAGDEITLIDKEKLSNTISVLSESKGTDNDIMISYNSEMGVIVVSFLKPVREWADLEIYDAEDALIAEDEIEKGITGLTYRLREIVPGEYRIRTKFSKYTISKTIEIK